MTWQPDAYNVVTNGHPRPVLDWSDLTEAEREEFDYITGSEQEDFAASFFRYRGETYDLGDGFLIAPDPIKALGFDEWQTTSYFDGLAVRRFDEDGRDTVHTEGTVVIAHIHW